MLEGKEVLIVEDDPVFRRMITGFLQSQGCETREAEDGLAGLRALRDGIPDILLCDLAMPVLTGMEFVEEVSLQYPMVPVIVISGTGEMADVANALRHGVKDFLVKPLDNIMVLKAALMSVLKAQDNSAEYSDFSSQLLQHDTAVDDELKWHIEELESNPDIARELLVGLMPETQSRQGDWQLNYCVLQSAEVLPVLLDYTWLMDGRLAFYLLDAESGGRRGAATVLLIRALFNDYLRKRMAFENDLNSMLAAIEQGMQQSGYAVPVRGLFGIFDACDRNLSVISVGSEAMLKTSEGERTMAAGEYLGQGARKNPVSEHVLPPSGARLSLSKIGTTNFSVTIQRLEAMKDAEDHPVVKAKTRFQ
ncbi:response regulator [Photobacterium sp. 1_MG-2023]|uniref:response regulator n=1 Tax=Photobacterium sp. 1_MG-2023 TaxID=3062646 RepID=UPI0026E23A53|nr:response regulator [Photobacterium sp. 1_MG-2023]MDO6707141.1 response regulator [Photobacterium sp. 1_MG-2023]